MNNGNIGSASNVIGNPVNLIMSNATVQQLQKYVGNLGLPSHALVVVNPLQSGTTTDADWNDLCVTDGNDGIKSLLPFTSIDKSQFEISTTYIGNRILTQKFPATSVDDKFFTYDNGMLSLVGNDTISDKVSKFNKLLDDKLNDVESTISKYDDTAKLYTNLTKELKELADKNDIVDTTKKNVEWISTYTDKIEDLNNKVKEIQDKYTEDLADSITYLHESIDNITANIDDSVKKAIDEVQEACIPENLKEAIENTKAEYDKYKAKLDGLVDNTKDELHREYEALKDSLTGCVNENLMPLVEAQVDSCLANEKVANMLDGAVNKVLLREFTNPDCGCGDNDDTTEPDDTIRNSKVNKAVLNSVDKALGGPGNANTETKAADNIKESVRDIAKDQAAIATQSIANMVTQATAPKYADKRYFDYVKLGTVDSEVPDTLKDYIVLTFSKELRDFLNDKGYSPANHGIISF